MTVFDTGVVHGRFQVLHNDHLKYMLAGKELCRHLIVGITNPDPILTRHDSSAPHRSLPEANPLTYYERYVVVREVLIESGLDYKDFSIAPLPINIPELIHNYVPLEAAFFLTIYDDWGERKLKSLLDLGINARVLWRKSLKEKGIAGSDVRSRMSRGEEWRLLVPPASARLMIEWQIPERLNRACS